MSMISTQIDELRERAKAFPDTSPRAALLLKAADTITELRGALQVASVDYRHLEAENTKLRELVRDMWNEGMCECGSRGKCARCEYGYPDRMRELGVEVDG